MKNVLLVSPLRSVSGYGTVARGIYAILKSLEKKLDFRLDVMVLRWGTFSETEHLDRELEKRVPENYDTVYDLAIMVSSPYDFRYYNSIFRAKHLVFFTAMVETKPFHPGLFQQLFQFMLQNPTAHLVFPVEEIKEIWREIVKVSSVHPALAASIEARLHVVSNPVDEIVKAGTFPEKSKHAQMLRLLLQEMKSSYDRVFLSLAPIGVERKNIKDLVLLAEKFPQVGFIVMAGSLNSFMLYDLQHSSWENFVKLPVHAPHLPKNVRLVAGSVPVSVLGWFIGQVDGGVNLSHGESWDYLLHNMLLLGKPCLFVDFFRRDYVSIDIKKFLAVAHELVPLPAIMRNVDPNHPFMHPQTFAAKPDLQDAEERLDLLLTNYDAIAAQIKKRRREYNTTDEICDFFEEVFESLEETVSS